MPGPWEKYGSKAPSGPWERYGTAPEPSAPPPSMLQTIGTGAEDLAKGLGESAVGLMSTGDEWARKHLPAFFTNTKMGFGPPANLENVHQMATPANTTQAIGKGIGDAAQFMIPGGAEEAAADALPRVFQPLGRIAASSLSAGAVNKAQGGGFGQGARFGGASGTVGEGLRAAAPIAQRAGLALGNTALGALSPKLFKYGADPARGAYEEGILPALSKSSAARKLESALPRVGERISHGVEAGSPIPLSDISQSIESPIRSARSIIEGPGGANRSSEPLNALQESMTRRAPGASQPIYGPDAGRPFSPEEAHTAMTSSGPLLLGAGTEDIPLAGGRYAGVMPTSQGRDVDQFYQFRRPAQGSKLFDAPIKPEEPMEPRSGNPLADISEYPGINPHYLSGGSHPEMSGRFGTAMGVLRRPTVFGESMEAPSALLDLRHPEATSSDLWRTIQNIDANTRFNPDPEVEGLNEVRRSIRGGLRGNLVEAAPGISAPSQTYSDLMGAQQGLDRSMHGGTSVGKLLSVPAFPLESTVGKLLYSAPKIVPAINRWVLPAATGTALQLTLPRKKEK